MNPVETSAALSEASHQQEPPPERLKAVLFCPECGHEGHATGDWKTKDDYVAGRRAIVCPECSTAVTERPLPNQSRNADTAAGTEGEWADAGSRTPWETWRDLYRSSVELFAHWPRNARC
jgi:hypothetical protein